MEPPIPRTPRDRAGERAREHDRTFRRTNPPPTISATEANRDYTFELQYGRSRERHTSPANRYPDNRPDRAPPPIPPASPEVISSLISSLAVISRPVSQHFDGPLDFGSGSPGANHLSVPVSPTTGRSGGSFGVDYGAFSQPSLDSLQEEDVPLDELPACPPVVKTSKRPSGYSSLTAPKSPLSPNRPSLKSLLAGQRSSSAGHGSRPSSRGSLTSATGSIGNLSLERGVASPLDMPQSLKKQRSHDSWSRAFSRGSKGLMYMSSKEQLRERELEKKRASVGAVGGSPNGHLSPRSAERQDPFLAETPITEEPHGESPPRASAQQRDHPRAIPVRESSLRKTGSTPKKSAARASRSSKRDSDTGPGPTIHEIDEPTNTVREQQGSPRKRGNLKTTQETDHEREPSVSLELPRQRPAEQVSNRSQGGDYFQGSTTGGAASPMSLTHKAEPLEEGAPSPAVAQGRRRDREVSRDRRRSGRQTPELLAGYISGDNGLGVKLKRSSTRLKRLSGVSSPTTDKPPAEQDKRNNGNTHSDQPTIAYERPRSADSIDDAVESYLCSPRLSQKIRHPQTGRVISFSEVGDPNGSAVFCCVGMGLTRYITAFYDELALTLKLRLITPDRPGVGDSEPYAEGTATPLGWPGTSWPFVSGYTSHFIANFLFPRRRLCDLPIAQDYQILHPCAFCRCHLRLGDGSAHAPAYPRPHSSPCAVDPALADVCVRCNRHNTSTAYQCHPYQPEDITSPTHTIPQGSKQQLHDHHQLQHHQFLTQAKARQTGEAQGRCQNQGGSSSESHRHRGEGEPEQHPGRSRQGRIPDAHKRHLHSGHGPYPHRHHLAPNRLRSRSPTPTLQLLRHRRASSSRERRHHPLPSHEPRQLPTSRPRTTTNL